MSERRVEVDITSLTEEEIKKIEEELRRRLEEEEREEVEPINWSPEAEGDSLVGQVIDIEESSNGKYKQLIVKNREGKLYRTPKSTVLTDLINKCEVDIGDFVMIQYTGEKVSKRSGVRYKTYKLSVVKASELKERRRKVVISSEEKEKIREYIESLLDTSPRIDVSYTLTSIKKLLGIPLTDDDLIKLITEELKIANYVKKGDRAYFVKAKK